MSEHREGSYCMRSALMTLTLSMLPIATWALNSETHVATQERQVVLPAPAAVSTNLTCRSTQAVSNRLPEVKGNLPGSPPEPLFMTHCSAQQSCPAPGGNPDTPISCTGHTSCIVGSYYVTCDGVSSYCSCWNPCGPWAPTCVCNCFAGGGSLSFCLRSDCDCL